MSDIAIKVESLSKRYKIGARRNRHDTLRDHLVYSVKSLVSRNGHSQPSTLNPPPSDYIWALKDISFEIKHGDVVGFIGRNGAGKSTLLKILSRITEPTTGRVEMFGRVGALLEVGTGFNGELTGRENIYLSGAILGMKKCDIDHRFDDIVAFAEVEKFIETPVKRYSSGMAVRLGFAVAAHLEPEILIVDEVLSVGDVAFQKKCLGKMDEVANQGRTILFVSHTMSTVENLCTHGSVIEAGQLHFFGNISDCVQKYEDLMRVSTAKARYSFQPNGKDTSKGARIVEAHISSGGNFSEIGYATGAPLEFRVTCQADGALAFPALGIGIDTLQGQRVVTLHSTFDSRLSPEREVAGQFEFVARTDNLALAPGDYLIKIELSNGRESLHAVEYALKLTILPTDYYRNGRQPGKGLILCKQEWEVRS